MKVKLSLYAGSHYSMGNGIVRTIRNYRHIRSSACALKCSLKWGNMRNPRPALQVSRETARDNWEEGEDDAKSAWPFDALGCTRGTMGLTMGEAARRR